MFIIFFIILNKISLTNSQLNNIDSLACEGGYYYSCSIGNCKICEAGNLYPLGVCSNNNCSLEA